MKAITKKTFTKMIYFVLATFLLVGCSSPAKSTAVSTGSVSTSTTIEVAPAKGNPENTVGAYVETDATALLPDALTDLVELRTGESGNLELVGISAGGKIELQARQADGTFTVQTTYAMPTGHNASLYNITDTGNLWTVEKNDDGNYALCTGTDSEAMTEIPVDAFSTGDAIPLFLRAWSDGTLLMNVQIGESTVLYIFDGDKGAEQTPIKITMGFYANPVFYQSGMVYALVTGSGNGTVYDAKTGAALQSVSINTEAASLVGGLDTASLQDDRLSYADQSGIHQIALDGNLQQTFADSKSFALASSSFHRLAFTALSDGSFWVVGKTVDGAVKLYTYSYDAGYVPTAGNELTIWTMEDCALLREAVNAFSTKYPECTVNVEYGSDSLNSGMTKEDVIKALNVEIFAGKGPDVIVLDGLPVDSYIRHGLLADLTGSVDTTGCYQNIVNCYQDSNGTYAIPMLFRPSILYCKSAENANSLATVQSLTDMQPLLCSKSNFHYDGYYNLFSELYPAASAKIFAPNGADVDETALREFLTVTGAVVQAQNITAENDTIFGSGENTVVAQGQGNLGVDTPASMNWYAREQDASDCACGSTSDYLMTYITIASSTKVVPALLRPLPGNVYTPTLSVGVLSNANAKDEGTKFIQSMLNCETEEVCARGSFNGFFIKKGVQLAHYGIRNDGSNGTPTPSQIGLDTVAEQFTTSSNTNLILRGMVYAEAQKYYVNQQSLEDAITNTLQKVNLYYAEQS